ncbi:LysR family transcriptional regulator [Vibrio sp. 10N.261.51.F12]|uniref:LysR family transcriptional regulator n=1 Tax=Vibrio sp. 10N.261.51.F12 TaxID=3229679 RepID=UPI00354D3320
MITIEQVHSFTLVYQHGSYSAAARIATKERSTIREHVVTLEDAIGVSLFEIKGRTATPTAAAHKLIARATNLSKQADDFSLAAYSLYEEPLDELVIMYDAMLPTAMLSDALPIIQRAYPRLPVHCLSASRAEAYESIEKGSCQVALMATENAPRTKARLASHFISTLPIKCYCHVTNPLVRRQGLSLNDLRLEPQLRLQATQEGDFASFSVANIIERVGSMELAISRLKNGGWMVMSAAVGEPWVKRGELVALSVEDAVYDYQQGICIFYGLANRYQQEIDITIQALIKSAKPYIQT